MALARPLVAADPAGIASRFVLAAALRRCGDLAAAQAALAPLVGPPQRAWGVFYEAGMIAAGAGETIAAAAALRTAVGLNPTSSLAAHALAGQRDLVGERSSAAADATLITAALALLDTGDAAPLAALGLFVSDVAVATIVAEAGVQHGRHIAVIALLTTALATTPGYLPARLTLATALARDHVDEAAAAVATVLAAAPASRSGRSLRAALAMAAGDVAAARADYAALTASDGDDAAAWHGLGHALRAAGDATGAVAAYRRALAADPRFAEVWWSLANLKTWTFAPADHAAMTALLAAPDVSADDRACLLFALGKADDDAGRAAPAFVHYAAGNAAQRSLAGFDRDAHRAFIDRTIALLTPDFFAARVGGDPARDPIFVVGLPRSGSTLVEQILASHPAVEGLSELAEVTALARSLGGTYPEGLADRDPADFARLGGDYLARVAPRRRLERARFVDKFPGNYLHLGLIHLMLPNATIVDVRRGAVATCWSLFKQRFAAGQAYSSDLTDLGHVYADYVRLIDHVAAVRPGRVLTLSYEALVDDTEAQVRRLLDHCRLPFDATCLAFHTSDRVVRTPSSEQVRQPIFRTGLDDWRRFTPWLGPLFAALGPLAER